LGANNIFFGESCSYTRGYVLDIRRVMLNVKA